MSAIRQELFVKLASGNVSAELCPAGLAQEETEEGKGFGVFEEVVAQKVKFQAASEIGSLERETRQNLWTGSAEVARIELEPVDHAD
jgi:hypothetical protein